MPESYKWLIVHRKEKQLQKWLQLAAKFNNIPVPDTKFITAAEIQNGNTTADVADDDDDEKANVESASSSNESRKKEEKISFWQMLKHRELRRRLCLGCTIS